MYYEGSGSDTFRIRKYYYEEFDTGIDALEQQASLLSIYPNPAGDRLNLVWKDHAAAGKSVIVISDYLGRELLRREQIIKTGDNTMDLSQLPPGTYLLRLDNAKGLRLARKLIRR